MRKLISALCVTLMSVGALGSAETASAAPLTIQQPVEATRAAAPNEYVKTVQYYDDRWDRRWDRGRHYGWRHHHRGWGRPYYYRPYYRPYYRRWDRPYWDRPRYYRPYYYRRWDGPYYRSWDRPYDYMYYRRNGVHVILDF
jgi:hypothetical protein